MNMSVITSFAIGGAMLISILALNNQVMMNSSQSTVNLIIKMRLDDAAELITNDFKNIGNYYGNNDPIVSFEKNGITFWGGVYADSTGTWDLTNTRVTWYASSTESVTTSENPNDYYLTRTAERFSGGSVVETHNSRIPVSHFEIKYLNAAGTQANYRAEIKSIEVEVICENKEPVNFNHHEDPVYDRVLWKKRFFPENLQRME